MVNDEEMKICKTQGKSKEKKNNSKYFDTKSKKKINIRV